jgi:hypothetical protein
MLIGVLDTDKVQAIIERGQHVVAVLSAPARPGDIEIVALPISEETAADIVARGLEYLAVAGILEDAPEIEMARPLPEDVTFAVGAAHQRFITSENTQTAQTANA